MKKATFPFVYTHVKTNKCEFHIRNTIVFICHSFLEHLLCLGCYLYPEDTIKTKTDSTQNLSQYH